MAVGVPRHHVPLRQDLTPDLDVETTVAYLAAFLVATVGTAWATFPCSVDLLGHVALVYLEERDGGVDAATQKLVLDPDFVVGAGDRAEQVVIQAIVGLQLVDFGVAGIDRGVVGDIVDDAAIRDDLVLFLERFHLVR